MCGIAGFSGSDPEARRTVAAMIAALAHRGPDGSGIFVDRGIALGHCRLAIIDPHGGAQPRIDPDSGDALIFNGEIYGYRALQDELHAAGIPLLAGREAVGGKPTAYVCRNYACDLPVTDRAGLARQLDQA